MTATTMTFLAPDEEYTLIFETGRTILGSSVIYFIIFH